MNASERIYTIIIVVFAALAYAQVIGNFMLVIENINRSQTHHEQSLSFLQGYMNRHRFPPALAEKVLDFQSTNYTYLNANIGKHVYLRPEEEVMYLRKEEEERTRTLMRHQTLREAKRQRAADAAQAAADGGTYVVDEDGNESFVPAAALTPTSPSSAPPVASVPGSSSWLEEAIEEFDCEMDARQGGAHAIGNSGRGPGGQHKQTNASGDGRLHERSEDRILSTLPSCYSLEIMLHLHGRLIYNVFMFRDLNSSILSALTKELRTRLYVRDDFVTKRKLMGRRMYLVKRGVVERIEFSDLGKKIAMAARRSHEEMQAREKKEEEKKERERERSSTTQPDSIAARLLKRTRSTSSMHTRVKPSSSSSGSGKPDYAALSAALLTAKPTIRRHNEGYVFGESSFLHGYFDETVRVASAVAEICVLEYSSFLRISEAYPEFARCVLGAVEKRMDMERAKSAAEQNKEKEREARAMRKIERQQTVSMAGRKGSLSTAGRRKSLEQVLHGDMTKHSSLSPIVADAPVALSPTLTGCSATICSPSQTSFAGNGVGGVSSQGSTGMTSQATDDVPRGSFATSITQLPPPAISGNGSTKSTTSNARHRAHLSIDNPLHKSSSSEFPPHLQPRPSLPLLPDSSYVSAAGSRRASRTGDHTREETQDSREDRNESEDSGNTDQPLEKYSVRHVSLLSQPASASISVDRPHLIHRRSLPATQPSMGTTSIDSHEERKEVSPAD